MLGPLKIFFPRMTELGPQSPIGAMPCDPDRLRSGLQPDGYLRIGIALRIPRQEAALAGGHACQHSRNVRRGARGAVGLEPALLGIGRELLPFAHAALPLLGNSMPERLPEVGQGVVEGRPVVKDLQQGGIDQGLGIQGVEVIPGTQVCTAGGLLLRGKPLEPGVHPGGCRGGSTVDACVELMACPPWWWRSRSPYTPGTGVCSTTPSGCVSDAGGACNRCRPGVRPLPAKHAPHVGRRLIAY